LLWSGRGSEIKADSDRRHVRASLGQTLNVAELIATMAEELIGWLPDRQPWRAVVAMLYVLGAAVAVAVCVWLVVTTW
jgi:hypothetical protein